MIIFYKKPYFMKKIVHLQLKLHDESCHILKYDILWLEYIAINDIFQDHCRCQRSKITTAGLVSKVHLLLKFNAE